MKRIVSHVFIALNLLLSVSCSAVEGKAGKTENKNIIVYENSIVDKILCGYQGWFNTPNDGADLGWKHYKNSGKFEPGMCSIDFWPEMSEYSNGEKDKTAFKNADGSKASIFSSTHPKTVNRHFKWMKDYGIDGVFIQRFVSNFKDLKLKVNVDKVYDNCFKASVNNDRLISVMYDFSGSKREVVENTKNDWKQLVDKYGIQNSSKKNVLTYKVKAVVALWGVGFKNREYTLDDVEELINFFKNDPKYGGCSVLLGVPTGWRSLGRDCINDERMHKVIKMADIVHPWTPGRYNSLETADKHKENYTVKDQKWCDANDLLYMPVVFPGFSWHNLKKGKTPLNQIPRLKGDFLWNQFYNGVSAGAKTIYVAMFDEMDEGTCIFKCTDNPPVGKSPFATYEGLPSDYYLWLTGKAGEMLRKEIPLTKEQPMYDK